ncbi:hypothetical protein AMAG_01737 [Allomyces macrogynus ATCC 38327]|uniref:Uncharacterized protein n=1 Tax=Allomyces macrogynus (strain ATCC 38327) TaxID=578462 RepID=A0A0L0S0K1_ALLM3|nr:hypothetical protein AMAG_01737 [Allomyces macrogynus ATCC 38327]|eukprot:KNE55869.1 hypothetical protein AMAG_01737 [Allomyces macrogynus ATCC 38327]
MAPFPHPSGIADAATSSPSIMISASAPTSAAAPVLPLALGLAAAAAVVLLGVGLCLFKRKRAPVRAPAPLAMPDLAVRQPVAATMAAARSTGAGAGNAGVRTSPGSGDLGEMDSTPPLAFTLGSKTATATINPTTTTTTNPTIVNPTTTTTAAGELLHATVPPADHGATRPLDQSGAKPPLARVPSTSSSSSSSSSDDGVTPDSDTPPFTPPADLTHDPHNDNVKHPNLAPPLMPKVIHPTVPAVATAAPVRVVETDDVLSPATLVAESIDADLTKQADRSTSPVEPTQKSEEERVLLPKAPAVAPLKRPDPPVLAAPAPVSVPTPVVAPAPSKAPPTAAPALHKPPSRESFSFRPRSLGPLHTAKHAGSLQSGPTPVLALAVADPPAPTSTPAAAPTLAPSSSSSAPAPAAVPATATPAPAPARDASPIPAPPAVVRSNSMSRASVSRTSVSAVQPTVATSSRARLGSIDSVGSAASMHLLPSAAPKLDLPDLGDLADAFNSFLFIPSNDDDPFGSLGLGSVPVPSSTSIPAASPPKPAPATAKATAKPVAKLAKPTVATASAQSSEDLLGPGSVFAMPLYMPSPRPLLRAAVANSQAATSSAADISKPKLDAPAPLTTPSVMPLTASTLAALSNHAAVAQRSTTDHDSLAMSLVAPATTRPATAPRPSTGGEAAAPALTRPRTSGSISSMRPLHLDTDGGKDDSDLVLMRILQGDSASSMRARADSGASTGARTPSLRRSTSMRSRSMSVARQG